MTARREPRSSKPRPPTTLDDLRLVGIRGTNKVMAGELSRLARRAFDDLRLAQPAKEGLGALVYPFEPRLAALAVHYHRTASRVLWTVAQSQAPRLEPLYDDLRAAFAGDERGWLTPEATFSVQASNVQRFAAGERQVVGVVKNALIDGAEARGLRLSVDPYAPDLHVNVRMRDDTVLVSLDLAGRPMNQRGYRTDRGAAPLRENLAAALVMLARHDPRRELLLDPMAGSATIAIEAACMARARPLWIPPRAPAAEHLGPLAEAMGRPTPPLFGDTEPLIVANEIDGQVHRIANRNLRAAGVEREVRSLRGDFRALDVEALRRSAEQRGLDPDRGLIVCNPPYGERIAPDQLEQLYRDLGDWCRERFGGWRAAFLVANEGFREAFGGRPRITKPLPNAALPAMFYLYDL